LLKEKRQAVISHAVTKGLNPDAPMRDSGVEWLGDVPEHWTVCRIKQVAELDSGHTPSKAVPEYWENCTIPWVSLNDTRQLKQTDRITETAVMISESGMANSSAHLLPAGCVVFTRDATIGLAAITMTPMAVSQHLIAWICDPTRVLSEYLLLVIYGMEGELERFTFDEQRSIVKNVQRRRARLAESIARSERLLELLGERRSALISAAVTGKIDVRGWTTPVAEAVVA
jgi:type I restriction enzyme S subunit